MTTDWVEGFGAGIFLTLFVGAVAGITWIMVGIRRERDTEQ